MSKDSIRVGVIGAGANTRSKHIPGLLAIEGVEIVSICNRSRASSERVAEQFGIPTIYENGQALIEATDTDAIVIGTWPYMHHRLTLAALAAGKHVMCEARMAMNAREAVEMRAAARANSHLIAQIVPSPYSLTVDRAIQRLLADGYVGALLAIEVRAGNSFIDKDGPKHWRHDMNLSGLNVMGLGIWYEALMRWVGEAKTVSALGKSVVTMRYDAEAEALRPTPIPEHVNVLLEMACGAQASIQMSTITGLANRGPEVFLYGSEGTIRFADNALTGGRRGDSQLTPLEIAPEEVGSWRVEEEFVGAIRGQEVITHTSFEDGVKYMIFTEGVAQSLADARSVSLFEVARRAGA